ncbi:uncharacterized protein MELLADRAFT_113685 [Melampsora larici-populina 98AG31]|uniref:Uncharacterized protein n=1 Tax=Melampsora larici-populina (strain 98AG31 / pathotype 3-4-7) TaxID=747676 RepID=F4SAR4_MELLP|nr:uncharacterized protein MELLADRAFT_113685 [Melampsora larici-populina 98AG31]EGF98272.1 hypothetical protein MELLADRAFT_113685 [Melampsora larici-populina 98AG31]
MSNPNDINQFNASVKRTSDRIRGNSTSPPGQPGEATTDGTNLATGSSQPTGSTSTLLAGQARKGQKSKKGASPPSNTPDAPPTGSAPPPGGQSSVDEQSTNASAKEPAPTGDTTGANAIPGSNALGSQGRSATTQAGSLDLAESLAGNQAASTTSTTQLIAPEVINKAGVSNTNLPPPSHQSAQAKFLAGTNTILNRIDKCSPDAIKEWLSSKGYSLVPRLADSTESEVVKTGIVSALVASDTNCQEAPNPSQPVVQPTPATRPVASHRTSATPAPAPTSTSQAVPKGTATPSVVAGNKRSVPNEVFDLTADEESTPADKTEESTSTIKFSDKGIEAHGLVALSKYFASKMTTLDAYIPVSVFNPQWLRQDLLQQTIRPKTIPKLLKPAILHEPSSL